MKGTQELEWMWFQLCFFSHNFIDSQIIFSILFLTVNYLDYNTIFDMHIDKHCPVSGNKTCGKTIGARMLTLQTILQHLIAWHTLTDEIGWERLEKELSFALQRLFAATFVHNHNVSQS